MSIKYIDTSAKKVISTKKEKLQKNANQKLRLFLKSFLVTFFVTLGLFLAIALLLTIIIYPKASSLSNQIERTYASGKKVEASLKAKDMLGAKKDLQTLRNETKKTRDDFNGLGFVRFIPIVASYYKDGEHVLRSVEIAEELGTKTIDAISPYSDILGFKGESTTHITAEEKTQEIITTVVPQLVPLVDQFSQSLQEIQAEIGAINPNNYPASLELKGIKVRSSIQQAKDYLAEASSLVPQVKPLLLAAPEIAGSTTEKTYLILLQNDKELRPTGGFITSYGLARVKNGRLLDVVTDDIYQLDLKYKATELSPDAEKRYIGLTYLPIRDSNLSPDYVTSAKKFESMYNTIKGMPKVDGVFALDTEFVRTFLEATGPIRTKKTKEIFSAEKNRLGIPDVVYKLELHAEKINQSKRDRKGILGELMDGLLDKILNAKPDEMPKYISTFLDTVKRKHILFYFHNKPFQDFVEKYNAAGRIVIDYDGDYFHLNNSNFGGLKGNIYLKQSVMQDIKIDSDGTVTKSVDVTLNNPVKADGWLNSIYLNWMRIYVPKGSQIKSKKVQKDFTSGVEFNKEVYRGYGATYPLNSSVSNFTYQLPFKVKPGGTYKMLIQKQPGVDNIRMVIKINGVVREEFNLNQDTELKIPLNFETGGSF